MEKSIRSLGRLSREERTGERSSLLVESLKNV